MKRKLIMNLQLFGLGIMPRQLLNADGGGGTGGDPGTDGGGSAGTGDEGDEGGEGTEGDKSFDDVLKDKKHQSEFDKRIAKSLETAKAKWETEYNSKLETAKTEAEKLAKMNADEKAKYAEDKRIADLEKREKDINTRELQATAKTTLVDKGLPIELFEILNYESADTCSKSIEAVEKAFQIAVEKSVNDKLRGNGSPKVGGKAGAVATTLTGALADYYK